MDATAPAIPPGLPLPCQAYQASFRVGSGCAEHAAELALYMRSVTGRCWIDLETAECADAARAVYDCLAMHTWTVVCEFDDGGGSISVLEDPPDCFDVASALQACRARCVADYACSSPVSCACAASSSHPAEACCRAATDPSCTDPSSFCEILCSPCHR